MANPASIACEDPDGAPGSAATPAARQPADLAALTVRDDFLLELGEVLGGRASVHPADSIATAIEQLGTARRKRLLAIDARDTGDVQANVARAAEQLPGATIVVFAEAQAENDIAATLKGTKVFAVLTVPVDSAKTAAVLDAALEQADRDGPTDAADTPAAVTERPLPARPAAHSRSPQRLEPSSPPADSATRRRAPRTVIAAVLIGAVAGAAWYLVHGRVGAPAGSPARRAAARVAPSSQPGVDTSIVQGRVDDLLDRARRAMFERHFTAPKGANALVYYRSVLAVDPSNGEALDGLRRVGNVLISRFHDAMHRGQLPLAALALATLQVARPADPQRAALQRQLIEAEISQALAGGHPGQAAALLAEASQAGVAPAQLRSWQASLAQLRQSQQTDSLAAALDNNIRADDLTGPSGAQAQLAQLRVLAPASAATRRATRALTDALLAKARQDALAGHPTEAHHWLAAAQADGASPSDLATFQRQLAAEQAGVAQARVNALLALARARIRSGALTQPAADSAASELQAAESLHPAGATLTALGRARHALASALLTRAESAARAGEAAAAQADLAQALQWGATAAEIGSATGRVRISLRAARQPTAAELERLAAHLVRLRYVAPSYPDYALSRRISGRVTVQYVVDRNGIPRDLRVTASRPADVFNRSALDAIRSWRYKPVRFHGRPVEVPVRTLIRFELPN